ncbi:MAG: amidohydrolase [Pirellulales bacterium]|nr:amidohydrolase [Pirellulales bacterium]
MRTHNAVKILFKSLVVIGLAALVSLVPSAGATHAASEVQPEQADLILHNATVWTVDAQSPRAEAVAVRDGRIVVVGKNADALSLRGPTTEVIDLEGAFVMPGFNDTHTHFSSAARFYEFNIMAVGSQDEFVARIKDLATELPEGEWIVGGLWGAYDQWALGSAGEDRREPFRPDMRLIEEFTQDHPVFLNKFDNSEYAANRAALVAAGLDPDDPQVDGVEFLRDDQGLTGVFRGNRASTIFRLKAPRAFSKKRRVQQTKRALEMIAAAGVTNISDMSDDRQLQIFRELHAAGELPIRIHYRYMLDRWPELKARGIKVGSGDPWIRLGALKGHIDGIMGTSSARFFEPYSNNPTNRGSWRKLMTNNRGEVVPGQFLNHMLEADKAGLQLTVHAIGDEANHLLLNYLEELQKQNGPRDRRFRLVHAQVLSPSDFARLGPLGVIAEVQPFHLSDDMRWMELRIGRKRCETAYAFRSIQDSGATLAFGSDWPGTSAAEYPINPLLALYAAVTRQTVNAEPAEGWFGDERVSIQDAIKASTLNAAYANFEEDDKGSISVGKLADITVLSHNLLEIDPSLLLKTDVLYTIVDGRIVYQRSP